MFSIYETIIYSNRKLFMEILIICLVNVCYGKNIEKFYRVNFNISIIRFFFLAFNEINQIRNIAV